MPIQLLNIYTQAGMSFPCNAISQLYISIQEENQMQVIQAQAKSLLLLKQITELH